jgi:hypothetical protein
MTQKKMGQVLERDILIMGEVALYEPRRGGVSRRVTISRCNKG